MNGVTTDNSQSMFINCNLLQGGNGTKYSETYNGQDISTCDVTMAVIDTVSTPGYLTLKVN